MRGVAAEQPQRTEVREDCEQRTTMQQSSGVGLFTGPDLLLADLHLPPRAADAGDKASFLNEAFLRFCAGPARAAKRVYLMGDLFETWIGDDVGLADYPQEIAALRALTAAGVSVFVQVGNRDFLLGRRFAAASGVTLLPDPVVVDLGGVPTLLSHGDAWCTDDVDYQRWRRFSRKSLSQWIFLRLPLARRRAIAGDLRGDGEHNRRPKKPASIMDVNADAIRAAFARHGVTRMIHGHTHRPAEHREVFDGRATERIVLADWRPERLEYLAVDAAGWRRCLL